MRKLIWILAIICCTNSAFAQHPSCSEVQGFESSVPIYPPIARAAHLQGTFQFAVDVYPDGHSDVRFLNGPSKGMNHLFVVSGRKFLESRRYGWVTGGEHHVCTYKAEIEYRFRPGEVNFPNNFMRLTDVDLSHTIVEVKATKPVVEYSESGHR